MTHYECLFRTVNMRYVIRLLQQYNGLTPRSKVILTCTLVIHHSAVPCHNTSVTILESMRISNMTCVVIGERGRSHYSSLLRNRRSVTQDRNWTHIMHQRFLFGMYTLTNNNPSAWNFLSPKPEVTCGTVTIIIRVVLLSPYLGIRAVSLSSIHYNQSHRVYINRRQQYICLIWN